MILYRIHILGESEDARSGGGWDEMHVSGNFKEAKKLYNEIVKEHTEDVLEGDDSIHSIYFEKLVLKKMPKKKLVISLLQRDDSYLENITNIAEWSTIDVDMKNT